MRAMRRPIQRGSSWFICLVFVGLPKRSCSFPRLNHRNLDLKATNLIVFVIVRITFLLGTARNVRLLENDVHSETSSSVVLQTVARYDDCLH
jgi:hypothetical protein